MDLILKGFGGPDRDRTDDLFHAMEARSQLRHRPTSSRGCNIPILASPPAFVNVQPCDDAAAVPQIKTIFINRDWEHFRPLPVSKKIGQRNQANQRMSCPNSF